MDEQKTSFLILILSLGLALALYFYFNQYLVPRQVPSENKTARKEIPLKPALFRKSFKGQDIVVETERYRAVINTEGGVLKSLVLKDYKDDEGHPMELIPPSGFLHNYSENKTLEEILNSCLMDAEVINNRGLKKVVLSCGKAGFVKTYTFHDDYRIDISLQKEGVGLFFGPKVAPKDRHSKYSFSGPLVYQNKKAKEIKLKKKNEELFKNPEWIALQSLYFTFSLIPKSPVTVRIKKMSKDEFLVFVLPEKGKLLLSWAFVGPKKYDLLKSYGIGLEENIRFGIFGFISKPLLYVMNFFYGFVHNYGVAIIILTLAIKILFHPLTVKGYKSMNKLKELQPLIQQIREAYKDDPQKMNQELMLLYKKHKINPFGGCLPLLLQIPVFFALYKLLMVSIELRHAPFVLWIKDLSAKDPYYITPILMGVTMFVQQLLTPGQDPKQNKFMLFLPVVFTVIFLNFPSGLVLYFLVNNLITIGEQLMIKHIYK